MNPIDQARTLAGAGHAQQAIALLKAGGKAGGANCWFELAAWYLAGRIVARDLARSRECFRRAGEAGHRQARMIYVSLLANGTGGPADWNGAMSRLREMSVNDAEAAEQLEVLEAMHLDADGRPLDLPTSRALSERPDVRLFLALLSDAECRYLITTAKPLLQPSVVVDPASGRMAPHPVRTSDYAAFPWIDETPVIHAINRRIAAASGSDVASGEPLQILRYRPGQQYRPHHDAVPDTTNQRVLTMLVYLNRDYDGGETHFLKTGLKVRGETGDAVLFRNASADGRADPDAQHAGLPVTAGEKLIASRWIRQQRFGPSS